LDADHAAAIIVAAVVLADAVSSSASAVLVVAVPTNAPAGRVRVPCYYQDHPQPEKWIVNGAEIQRRLH